MSAELATAWPSDTPPFPEPIPASALCADDNDCKEPAVIVEGLVAEGDLGLITAGSKSFKSWLALQLALGAANGIPFLGRQAKKTKTLFLNFELKEASIKRRLRAISSRLGCGQENLWVWNLRNQTITLAFLDALHAAIGHGGFGLIILDPLYSMYGTSETSENVENSNPAMTKLLSDIRRACEAAGAAVVIVHHHAKGDSAMKNSIDRASGAGALGRFPDFVMSLVRHEAPSAYVAEVDFRAVGDAEAIDPLEGVGA
jgi:RecA-family ATPase